MKRRAKLAMSLLSAAVLAGAWFTAVYMEADSAEQTAKLSEELETIRLAPGGSEDITALSWSWNGETVNLGRDGGTGRWVNTEDETCPVDDAKAEALARAAAAVTASMTVRGAEVLDQYGLASPALTVIAATDTDIVGYDVGNASVTGEYFLRIHGDDTVYLAGGELPTAFRVGILDMLALETVPEELDLVTSLEVLSEAGDYRIAWDSAAESWSRTDTDPPVLLKHESALALCGILTGAELTDCVTWKGEPAEYGLDAPQAAGTVSYRDRSGQEGTFTLEFGDYAEGDVYARFAGSSMVFRVPGSIADGIMYPRWEQMTPTPVISLEPDTLASLTVTLDGETYTVARLEEEVERPVSQREQTVIVTDVIYSLNGWVLDTQRMDGWLESFAELTAEESDPPGEGREELLSVTFTWKDPESSPFTLTLRNYDSTNYLCLAENDRLLVSRSAADALIDQARHIFIRE